MISDCRAPNWANRYRPIQATTLVKIIRASRSCFDRDRAMWGILIAFMEFLQKFKLNKQFIMNRDSFR